MSKYNEMKNERTEEEHVIFKKRCRAACNKYEKTPKGFAMRLYRNMQSRITGVQKSKFHLYEGKELLDRDSFYCWILNNDTYLTLLDEYEKSGYERRLAPSVDRIESSKGYTIDNIEIVTMSENSRRGTISKNRRASN